MIWTYNKHYHDGSRTFGGYSDKLVVEEHFAVQIPDNLPLEGVAPILCAGITVYSPMRHFGLFELGKHLGVVGLGGLGHMAVKFAKAVGAKVTVISTSPNKKKEAMEQLGVDDFLISHDQEQLQVVKHYVHQYMFSYQTGCLLRKKFPLLTYLKCINTSNACKYRLPWVQWMVSSTQFQPLILCCH
jgi:D-arabinose 1-dehydrogenase-like Zn-dependent alcohol dehydrogenase